MLFFFMDFSPLCIQIAIIIIITINVILGRPLAHVTVIFGGPLYYLSMLCVSMDPPPRERDKGIWDIGL